MFKSSWQLLHGVAKVKAFYFFSAQDLLKKILPFWDDMTDMDGTGLDESFALGLTDARFQDIFSISCTCNPETESFNFFA